MVDSIYQLISSAGGWPALVVAIIVGLAALARSGVLERFKGSQAENLARLEAKLEREDTVRADQSEAYKEVWETLAGLRMAADALWANASGQNLVEFGERFREVRRLVYGREVLIEAPHLAELQRLIDQFREFYDGKEGLVELRRGGASPDEVRNRIDQNGKLREEYATALDGVAADFRKRLGT